MYLKNEVHMKWFFAVGFSLLMFLADANAESKLTSPPKASDFDKWLVDFPEDLASKTIVVQTALGPVEYYKKGKGPIVLSLHGGFGGWDQGFLIAENLADQGFTVLSVSRSGYLRTPMPPLPPETEYTAAQQADLMAAFLDALNIPEVAVLGFSAGAPVAYEFALKYPNRAWATVLESIGASPQEDSLFYAILGEVLSQPVLPDFFTYLVYISLLNDYYSTAKITLGLDTTLTGPGLNERINYVTSKSLNQYLFLYQLILSSMPITPRLPGILNDFLGINFWTTDFSPTGYNTPTLIVQSINDSNGYYPTAKDIQAQLSNVSQLITVFESGHIIWLGPYTHQWEKQVTAFLHEHAP